MSTKAIREVIEAYRKTNIPIPERHPKVLAALVEVEAIEKAAAGIVDWNAKGQPGFHVEAARGFDVLVDIVNDRVNR